MRSLALAAVALAARANRQHLSADNLYHVPAARKAWAKLGAKLVAELGPEALLFDARGAPTFAPLPDELVDEFGRPLATRPSYEMCEWVAGVTMPVEEALSAHRYGLAKSRRRT